MLCITERVKSEWEGDMKNQMALTVSLKAVIVVVEDCCDLNTNGRAVGFLRPESDHTYFPCRLPS